MRDTEYGAIDDTWDVDEGIRVSGGGTGDLGIRDIEPQWDGAQGE